jgi:hypothetical protein
MHFCLSKSGFKKRMTAISKYAKEKFILAYLVLSRIGFSGRSDHPILLDN